MKPGSLRPDELTCEYRRNPLGLGETKPRLGWILRTGSPRARNEFQRAYRILAASSPGILAEDKGDLWDTGKVDSSATGSIPYRGRTPRSRDRVCWKVRIWDQDGRESPWSETARWTMGLLNEHDWNGAWIESPARWNFDRVHWVWHPGDSLMEQGARAGKCIFKREFTVPRGIAAVEGRILIAAKDGFCLSLNGSRVSNLKTETCTKPRIVDFTKHIKTGKNILEVEVENRKAGEAAGLAAKAIVSLDNGSQIVLPTNWQWLARWSDERGKKTSRWIKARGFTAAGELGGWVDPLTRSGVLGEGDPLILPPATVFRRTFELVSVPQRAVLNATAFGIYRLYLNGKPIGDDWFTPGWCEYGKRVYAHSYEVAEFLRPGSNTLVAVLADGWFAGYVGFCRRRNHYDGERRIRLQLEIPDGDTLVATDGSWQCTDEGPWREADLQMGETFDARRDWAAFHDSGFDGLGWDKACVSPDPGVPAEPYPGEPVRAAMELPPQSLTEPQPGVYVFDMGQNMVGVARLRVSAPAGSAIRLRFAEVLTDEGMVYTEALRGARATDTYIKACDGFEEWTPAFTFHGFRYVEITGIDERPGFDTVTGIVLHTAMSSTHEFESSSALVNRLQQNTVWSQRGNYLEVPTDCPQRDERLGWTGDAQIFIRAGSFNFDIAAFFGKWLRDLFDTQRPDGGLMNVAPNVSLAHNPEDTLLERSCAGWQDAAIVCPHALYRVYGDTRIIHRYYDGMTRFMNHLARIGDNHIQPDFGFGDWVNLNAETPKPLLGTAYYARNALMMAEMAEAIGKRADEARYRALFDSIREAFQKTFIEWDGQLQGHTQTAYALAIRYGLLTAAQREKAAHYLTQDVAYRRGAFSTGFLGLKELLPALTEIGQLDMAFSILENGEFPSWGYQIRNGATTIWERWDGWTEEHGLQTPNMNSFNHYAFGAVNEWLFATVAGIDLLEPGYRRIAIAPHPGGTLKRLAVQYRSPLGWIGSSWRIRDGEFHLGVRIPPNATSEVSLPCAEPTSVTLDGQRLAQGGPVRLLDPNPARVRIEVPSGHYRFVCPLERL